MDEIVEGINSISTVEPRTKMLLRHAIRDMEGWIDEAIDHRHQVLKGMQQQRIDLRLRLLLTKLQFNENILPSVPNVTGEYIDVIIKNLKDSISLEEVKKVLSYPVVRHELQTKLDQHNKSLIITITSVLEILVSSAHHKNVLIKSILCD